jgi:hypothetical protein
MKARLPIEGVSTRVVSRALSGNRDGKGVLALPDVSVVVPG